MARINIEESIFTEKKFLKLSFLLGGDPEKAIGALIYFWRASQKAYLLNGGWISPSQWRDLDLCDAIKEAGLCEEDSEGRRRALDADNYFGWLKSCSDAGKRGSMKKSGVKTTPAEIINKIEQGTLTDVEGSTTSLFSSPSSLLSSHNSLLITPISNTKNSSEPKQKVLVAAIPEFENVDYTIVEVFTDRNVTEAHQRAWLTAYPDAVWIVSEIRKALAWEATNPMRKKKNFSKFMTNWFNRSWDSRILPGRGTRQQQVTAHNAQQHERIKKGEL